MGLKEKREEYFEARRQYDVVHKESARLHKQMKNLEGEFRDAMTDEGQRSMKVADPGYGELTIYLSNHFSCSVTTANEMDVRQWLLDVEGDDQPYLTEKVNKTAVQDLLKKNIETGKLDEMDVPGFLNLKTSPRLTVKGWPKS